MLGGLTFLIVLDVILRYIFNQPLDFALELVERSLSLVVFFGLIICTARRGHIEINLFVTRLPQRVQDYLNILVDFLSTGLFGVIAWRCFAFAIHNLELGVVTPILTIPIYPFILIIALCSVLVTFVLLSQFIHSIIKAVSR